MDFTDRLNKYLHFKDKYHLIKNYKYCGGCHEEEHPAERVKLDPLLVPKYVNQLKKPLTYRPQVVWTHVKKHGKHCIQKQHQYNIDIGETKQQMLGLAMMASMGQVLYLIFILTPILKRQQRCGIMTIPWV